MPESRTAHGLIVLAAGDSSRLGEPKQLLRHRGETLIHRAARLGLSTAPADAVIVLGAHTGAMLASVQDLPIRHVDSEDWPLGLSHSLRAGIAALSPDCAGALILLCDQVALEAQHLGALVDAWRSDPLRAVASRYAERLGVPALLPRAWFADLQELEGDRGAGALLAQRSDEVIAIDNAALAIDIDRAVDLHWLET